MLLNMKNFFCKYPQVPVDICGFKKKICRYPHNEYPYGYGYGYETNIYTTGRIRESYYPYPTRFVDIPNQYFNLGQVSVTHLYSIL